MGKTPALNQLDAAGYVFRAPCSMERGKSISTLARHCFWSETPAMGAIGSTKVLPKGARHLTLREGPHPVTILGAGTIVGELSMFDGAPRSASVVAIRASKLSFVSRAIFDEVLHAHPEILSRTHDNSGAPPAGHR